MAKRIGCQHRISRGSDLTALPDLAAEVKHPLADSADPVAQLLCEALPMDHPQYGVHYLAAAGYQLKQMQGWGAIITPEIVANVLADVIKSPVVQGSAETRPTRAGAVVYYVRLGNRVKIGTTTSFANRMASLQPEEVLATEPGGYELERFRHQQFADLRVTGEWFRLEAALVEHIAALVAA